MASTHRVSVKVNALPKPRKPRALGGSHRVVKFHPFQAAKKTVVPVL